MLNLHCPLKCLVVPQKVIKARFIWVLNVLRGLLKANENVHKCTDNNLYWKANNFDIEVNFCFFVRLFEFQV